VIYNDKLAYRVIDFILHNTELWAAKIQIQLGPSQSLDTELQIKMQLD